MDDMFNNAPKITEREVWHKMKVNSHWVDLTEMLRAILYKAKMTGV